MTSRHAVIFDVGRVLVDWQIRFLYERLIPEGEALDAFLRDVVTEQWHFQHDQGRPFAETSAELIALHPQHADLIELFGPRFNDTNSSAIPGMPELLADLDSAGVPLFAITNFSGEFFPPFRVKYPDMFDRFRDIVVSGDEKMMKPDPAIYRLALDRFGLKAEEAVFVDDNRDNVAGAAALGIHAIRFIDEPALRAELRTLGFAL